MEDPAKKKAVMAAVRAAMPQVAKMVAEKRAKFGDEWVTGCIERAMRGEPGYFFAREGPLAFGTPWDNATVLAMQAPATAKEVAGGVPVRAVVVMLEPAAVAPGPANGA